MSAAYSFRPGQEVRVKDAYGEWLYATALTDVEATHSDGRKIHDFPVVWVEVHGKRIPWPWEDVRPV